MADIRYFNGTTRLQGVHSISREQFAAEFPGVKALKWDLHSCVVGRDEVGRLLPAERKVEFKKFASRHDCDARCLNAQGKTMSCECSCGGENHGRGTFTRLVETSRVLAEAA